MRNRQNGLNGRSDSASVRGKAMSSPAAERVYGKHGGYRNLKAYQVAELLYDFTCRFCARYILKSNRHHDQMVQAARSGYQNIAEGSEDSATSKKLEMNLTNVARSSLDEARKDYIKHLMRRGLSHWPESAPSFSEARSLRPQTVEEAAAWATGQAPANPLKNAPPTWAPSSRPKPTGSPSVCWTVTPATSRRMAVSRNASTARAPASHPIPFRLFRPLSTTEPQPEQIGFQTCQAKPDGRSMVKESRARYIVRNKHTKRRTDP